MMKTYTDRYGFMHDKPTDGSQPSSWNPLIYSAIYDAVSGKLTDFSSPFNLFMRKSFVMNQDITIFRHPDNLEPTSLDEIIGAIYLGLLKAEELEDFGYRWHDTLHNPSRPRILQAIIYVAGKHRNFFKDNNVRDLHPVAYRIPPHIKYYMHKKSCKRVHVFAFYFWLFLTFMKPSFVGGIRETGNVSQKNIAYIILLDLSSKWLIKLIDYKKHLRDYFDYSDHPIIRHLDNN